MLPLLIDGAELLLDLGLPAAIIGGIVLPLLGAVPDSAMIIASGIAGSRDAANAQISVGMGYASGFTEHSLLGVYAKLCKHEHVLYMYVDGGDGRW